MASENSCWPPDPVKAEGCGFASVMQGMELLFDRGGNEAISETLRCVPTLEQWGT